MIETKLGEDLVERAKALFDTKDFAAAMPLLREAVGHRHCRPNIRLMHVQCALNCGLAEEADAAISQLEEVPPRTLAALLKRLVVVKAFGFLGGHDFAGFITYLREAIVTGRISSEADLPNHQRLLYGALAGDMRLAQTVAATDATELNGAVRLLLKHEVRAGRKLLDAARAVYPDCALIRTSAILEDLGRGDLDAASLAHLEREADAIDLIVALQKRYNRHPLSTRVRLLRRLNQIVAARLNAPPDERADANALFAAMFLCDTNRADQLAPRLAGSIPFAAVALEHFREGRARLGTLWSAVAAAAREFQVGPLNAQDILAATLATMSKDAVTITVPAFFGFKNKPHDVVLCVETIATAVSVLDRIEVPWRLCLGGRDFGVSHLQVGEYPVLGFHTVAGPEDIGLLVHRAAYVDGYVSLDAKGYAGWSSVAKLTREEIAARAPDNAAAHRRVEAVRHAVVSEKRTKYDQPIANKTIAPGYVLCATQIVDDAVQSLARIPHLDFLASVVRWADNRKARLVIKRHPFCWDEAITQLLNNAAYHATVEVVEAPIGDLIAGSRAVVVSNSGVGFEALLYGKPVITVGGSDYESVTAAVADEPGLWRALDDPAAGFDRDAVEQFLAFYFTEATVEVADRAAFADRLEAAIRMKGWDQLVRAERPARKPPLVDSSVQKSPGSGIP